MSAKRNKIKVNKFHNIWNKGSNIPEKTPIIYDIKELDDFEPILHFDSKATLSPNISSHTFVDVFGYNKFTSKGMALFKLFKLQEDEEFKVYYKIRGGIIEHLAVPYVEKLYPGCVANSHELHHFKSFNQFPEAKPFSAVADITITSPFKLSIEVKSKDSKDMKYIIERGDYPEHEVKQGEFIAELFGSDQYMMLWGFISHALEFKINKLITDTKRLESYVVKIKDDLEVYDFEAIVNDLKLTVDSPHIVWHHKIYDVDHVRIRKEMKEALDLRNQVILHKGIPINLFFKEDFEDIVTGIFETKK